jgi:hypothetical protein
MLSARVGPRSRPGRSGRGVRNSCSIRVYLECCRLVLEPGLAFDSARAVDRHQTRSLAQHRRRRNRCVHSCGNDRIRQRRGNGEAGQPCWTGISRSQRDSRSRDDGAWRIFSSVDSAHGGNCPRGDCVHRHCRSIRDDEGQCAALVRAHLPNLWPSGGVGWWNSLSRQTYRPRCVVRDGTHDSAGDEPSTMAGVVDQASHVESRSLARVLQGPYRGKVDPLRRHGS